MPRGQRRGFTHTPESRAKMSAAHKGKQLSATTRAKMSAARNGHPVSAETRAKIRAAHLGKNQNSLRHGHAGHVTVLRTPTYRTWQSMITRCTCPAFRGWKYYGGRGITVCDRWRTFENFLADMGARPPGTSIDRIDVNGHYEPGNCRWATRSEQNRNQRRRNAVAA